MKEQIISDCVKLRDYCDIIKEESDALQEKIKKVSDKNKILHKRAVTLACKVEHHSPVFSEAEDCMKKEMEGLTNHIHEMHLTTQRVCCCSLIYYNLMITPPCRIKKN